MPFTLSHPALVLPLRGRAWPTSSLVVGSVVLDVPKLFGADTLDGILHHWIGGLVLGPVLGLITLVTWVHLLRAPLIDLSPDWLRDRMPGPSRRDRSWWRRAWVGLLVGVATHLLWDAFTHKNRWGDRHVAWLHETHAGYPGYLWAQYVSSVLGVLVVAWYAVHDIRRTAPRARHQHVRGLTGWLLFLPPILALVIGSLATLDLYVDLSTQRLLRAVVIASIASAGAAVLAVCALWHLHLLRRGRWVQGTRQAGIPAHPSTRSAIREQRRGPATAEESRRDEPATAGSVGRHGQ